MRMFRWGGGGMLECAVDVDHIKLGGDPRFDHNHVCMP